MFLYVFYILDLPSLFDVSAQNIAFSVFSASHQGRQTDCVVLMYVSHCIASLCISPTGVFLCVCL